MSNDWWKPSLAEAIGTFALVFIGAGAVVTDFMTGSLGLLGVALAHALVLAIVISATGHISGGHINPAVTFGFMVTRRISVPLGLRYVGAQLVGALLAGLLVWALFPGDPLEQGSLGATLLNRDTGIAAWQGLLIEAVLTFFLVFAVFGTAVHPKAPKSIAGFGIGLVLAFDILVGGPLTGASMNPARSFGPALVGGFWADHWLYWIGPLAGGAVAALVYDKLFIGKAASS